ncbi:response regulator transcription factor [Marinirhabdus gelatinilytica]|uniref:LuxR family two component transcriptional regulator n=1 Tax=Marinirhabdus gelatinilytica TaxID=1703343 RepID=A0A370QF65_9FLAO|nr:response regulator transcription factor [Marinirhabdus gelatinilytica]RDK87014.1 LuxR family two component transcriptional regulator [Marinirhabdus gelatinilytica]
MDINIVIADDEELFRVGIAHIFSREPGMEVIFQAENGQELLTYLESQETLPDIVITDIKMPEVNGVEATKHITTHYPEVGVVALSTYNTKPFIKNMIDVGANAYLVKNSTPAQVIHTVKQVFHNGFYYDRHVMEILNKKYHDTLKSPHDPDFLTEREQEVLELICQQLTTPEIAKKLFISPRTVEVHRKNLLTKTGVKNLAGLVIFAIKHNLIPPIEIS